MSSPLSLARTWRSVPLLIAAILVLAACGGDAGQDDQGGESPETGAETETEEPSDGEDADDQAAEDAGTDNAAEDQEVAQVRLGVIGSVSDAGFYIAQETGLFEKYNLDVEFTDFDSAARMVAPLGQGEIDAGGGAQSAGLYNAVGSDVDIRAVADKGSSPAGYGYPFVVRADLVESGEVEELADLEGRTVAMVAEGSTAESIPAMALRDVGVGWDDFEQVYIPFPDQIAAFSNGSIDASMLIEPFATIAEDQGTVVRFPGSDETDPDGQGAVVLYSEQFISERPEVATRFMMAYVEAVRLYNDALADGGWNGPAADEVVRILVENTSVDDEELLRKTTPIGLNPDGEINLESMQNHLEFWRDIGSIEVDIEAEEVVDDTFRSEAVAELGPYEPQE